MSYLVLARKYRPQTFADVVGQEVITQTLQNAIRLGRVHHAFLFCGARGTGKTTMARILAKALSCKNAPTPTPCNECEACIEISQGTSIDVQEIDAASQNKVEDIRELRDAIRYAPVRGKKKIFILDEVHMLSTSAFNALLKTLEEPPPHAVFIFATTDPHKLPQTILSRVQRYDFKLVPLKTQVDHLASILTQEQISFERNALILIAKESGGSIRDALSLLDQVLAAYPQNITETQVAQLLGVADRSLILELTEAILQRTPEKALLLLDQAYERGYDLVQLAKTLTHHFRDLVMVQTISDAASFLEVTSEELQDLQKQASLAQNRAMTLFSYMLKLAEETARSSQIRFFLEIGIIELCHLEPILPLDEFFNRLESLEAHFEPHLATEISHPNNSVKAVSRLTKSSTVASLSSPVVPFSNPIVKEASQIENLSQTAAVSQSNQFAQKDSIPQPNVLTQKVSVSIDTFSNKIVTPDVPIIKAASSDEVTSRAVIPMKTEASLSTDVLSQSTPPALVAPHIEEWDQVARKIMEKSPLLHVLAMSHPIKWDSSSLILGMSTPFLAEQLKAKRTLLEECLRTELGKQIQVEIQVVTGLQESKESVLEVQQRKEEEEKQKRKTEALKHPSRKILTDVFGDGIVFRDPILE